MLDVLVVLCYVIPDQIVKLLDRDAECSGRLDI